MNKKEILQDISEKEEKFMQSFRVWSSRYALYGAYLLDPVYFSHSLISYKKDLSIRRNMLKYIHKDINTMQAPQSIGGQAYWRTGHGKTMD